PPRHTTALPLRAQALARARRRQQQIHRARPHRARAQRLPGRSGASLQDLRAEDPAGVSSVPAAERRLAPLPLAAGSSARFYSPYISVIRRRSSIAVAGSSSSSRRPSLSLVIVRI